MNEQLLKKVSKFFRRRKSSIDQALVKIGISYFGLHNMFDIEQFYRFIEQELFRYCTHDQELRALINDYVDIEHEFDSYDRGIIYWDLPPNLNILEFEDLLLHHMLDIPHILNIVNAEYIWLYRNCRFNCVYKPRLDALSSSPEFGCVTIEKLKQFLA